MGQRGPKKMPTDILRLRGSWRAKARDKAGEPKPAKRAPPCPQWLTGEARACWKYVIAELKKMGVLAESDRNALARYCVLWSRWKKAAQFIEAHGESYPIYAIDKEGKVVYVAKEDGSKQPVVRQFAQFPQVATFKSLNTDLLRLEQQFGLTAASRPDLTGAGAPSGDAAPQLGMRDRSA